MGRLKAMRNTWALVLTFLSVWSGCSARFADDGAAKRDDQLLIAVVPKATSHEFWKSVHAGAVQGEKEAGVRIIWKGPITESDREAQINVVQDFIAQRVDGICLAPLDSQALIPVVREARAAPRESEPASRAAPGRFRRRVEQ